MNKNNVGRVTLIVAAVVAVVAAFVGLALIVAPSIGGSSLTPEQHFIQEVRPVFPENGDKTDREITKIGLLTCGMTENDTVKEAYSEVWAENGYTPRERDLVTHAAKKYLCDQ